MKQVDQLRAFIRVAELGSFTAAAGSLGLPKATVTVAVQALEADLGVQLFHRTTRRVRLTPDGQAALVRARQLVEDLDEWSQLFQRDGGSVRGRLRADLPLAIARDVVIPNLPAFLGRHPELTIELGSTDRFVDLLRDGFDCVLRVGSLTDSSLIAKPLGYYRVINCASRGYLKAHGTPKSPTDLSRHRLVYYSMNFSGPAGGFEYLDPKSGELREVAMGGVLTVNSSPAYAAAAAAGLGIVQLPEVGIRDRLQSGEFVQILEAYRPPALPVAFLYPNRRHLPTRVRVFMDWVGTLLEHRLMRSATE